MARPSSPTGPSWSFYLTTAPKYGHKYVIASYGKWDPVKKQPRIAERIHVGRLCDDGSVRLSKRCLEKFPQFAGKEIYYFENKLLEKDAYIQANPEALEEWKQIAEEAAAPKRPLKEVLENDWRSTIRTCGPTLAAWFHLSESGMLGDLQTVFGVKDGKLLAALAVYLFCGGQSMNDFSEWLGGVYLPGIEPMSGQRITELLARIDQNKIDRYFKMRFDRLLEVARQKRAAAGSGAAKRHALTIAFDSTSISTYSDSIEHAEFGHAKRDADLKQVNLAVACDQDTGEAVYGYEYAGSVNDKASLPHMLDAMADAGFAMNELEFVTDRGYKSMYNIQKQLNAGLRIIQGMTIDEKSVQRLFDKHMEKLRSVRFYSADWDCGCMPLNNDEGELWSLTQDGQRYDTRVNLHLYWFPQIARDAQIELITNAEAIAALKNEGRKVDATLWANYGKLVEEVVDSKNVKRWTRNNDAIESRLKYAGCFAIRTNSRLDPLDTLAVYRQRGKVEAHYRMFKNDLGGDRLFATQTSYAGKMFLFLLGTSIRMRIAVTMRRIAQEQKQKIPGNSLSRVLNMLNKVHLRRRGESEIWRPELITKKQRECFALLGVPVPRGGLS